jgi:CheY-like chemotaxis protein
MSKQILVIDNEPLVLDLFIHLLPNFGYYADQAPNGREAFGKLNRQEYDAIFLDFKMPDLGGKAFYQKVREHFPRLSKRIVFVTADLADLETISFINGTGNFYLEKPFTIRSIKNLLEDLFQTGWRNEGRLKERTG